MAESGIKGSAFESVVADVKQLVDDGEISTGELEGRLTLEDLQILDSKIQSALWYPLGTFGRLTEILLRKVGHGNLEYLLERGRLAAQRLIDGGVYSQLSASHASKGDRVGRVMVTLGPAMYKNTEWEHESFDDAGGQRGFLVTATIPAEFPDICRHPTLGFIDRLTRLATDGAFRVTSHRESPTVITFTGRPVHEA